RSRGRVPPAMSLYAFKRLALVGPMFLRSTLLIFVMMRLLPCDVVDQLIGLEGSLSGEARASLRRLLGLDAPLPVQYFHWLPDPAPVHPRGRVTHGAPRAAAPPPHM